MPTYLYRCNRCKHRFEEEQSITAAPLQDCPSCEEKALVRVPCCETGPQLTGTGFYKTDYGNLKTVGQSREENAPGGCSHNNCGCKGSE
ncbi:MAG: zinc ribbon domain-containing protein [Chlamydiia bacterium]|nr:zinc ribbon domain-containing protein [Chlamydiia bacterium]